MATNDVPRSSQDLPVVKPAITQPQNVTTTPSDIGAPNNPIIQHDQSMIASQPVRIPIPDEAADTDLIEKEWVERAKQIVAHTSDDPYEQQRAISQMKADYMKKRYNKDIKLAE